MFHIIKTLIVGAVSGWIASNIAGKDSSNMLRNICLGLAGAFVGSLLGGLIGIHSSNMIGSTIISVLGAVLLLFLYNKYIKS